MNDPRIAALLEVIAAVELSQEILFYHLFKKGILDKTEVGSFFDAWIKDATEKKFGGAMLISTLTRIRESFNNPPLDPFQPPDWLRGIKID